MRLVTSLARLAVLLSLLFPSACFGPKDYADLPVEEPRLERLTRKDRESGILLRSWTVLVYSDGRSVKHGPDRHWYPSGARLSEGSFDHGEPVGDLRRWYESGQLKSESNFDPAGALMPMRFWYENGQLSGSGLARRGHREGLWEFWYENGQAREQGGYIDGERSGRWIFYHSDGSLASRGTFDDGERVGSWQHFEPGERWPSGARATPAGIR